MRNGTKRRLVQIRQEKFNETVNALAHNLRTGRITLAYFEEEMRTQIRLLHTGMGAIGKGSWKAMTSSDWGRVGNVIKKQYRWLHGFAQDIYDRRETITEGQIAWRARLYGDAGAYTATIIGAGDVTDFLPWIPRDGSTECLNRCRCEWLLSEDDPDRDGMKAVEAVWTLHPAEHCATCVSRDGHREYFTVPAEMEIPATIGGYG